MGEEVDDDMKLEEDDDDDKEKEPETITETYHEYDQINRQQPIWTLDPKDITDDQYKSFYKGISNDYEDYSDLLHFKTEGNLEFTSLIFFLREHHLICLDKMKNKIM